MQSEQKEGNDKDKADMNKTEKEIKKQSMKPKQFFK